MKRKVTKATKSKKKLTSKEQFKKYLERIEDPNYQGGSWALPENATPLEKSKHENSSSRQGYRRCGSYYFSDRYTFLTDRKSDRSNGR